MTERRVHMAATPSEDDAARRQSLSRTEHSDAFESSTNLRAHMNATRNGHVNQPRTPDLLEVPTGNLLSNSAEDVDEIQLRAFDNNNKLKPSPSEGLSPQPMLAGQRMPHSPRLFRPSLTERLLIPPTPPGSSAPNPNESPIAKSFHRLATFRAVPVKKEDNLPVLIEAECDNDERVLCKWFTSIKDGRPDPKVKYFHGIDPMGKRKLCGIIPFYNEDFSAIHRTLSSIWVQAHKRRELHPHLMLILDGWTPAAEARQITHATTKAYLREMFSGLNGTCTWYDMLEDMTTRAEPHQTIVLQKIDRQDRIVNVDINLRVDEETNQIVRIGEKMMMAITLVIKRDNRKKHNSHEWFLGRGGFADAYRATYSLATDCGALFDKKCLKYLVRHLDRNKGLSVCTGRQRVMSAKQQGNDGELWFGVSSFLRLAQMYDYEASFACYMGTFALVGFLPVVPGPCGLYRTSVLLPYAQEDRLLNIGNSPCDWYFEVVNTEPDKSGLILGNLRIAEDRVLSYASVLKAHSPSRMGLVPEAIFFFEAERDLKSLVLQRRRWINGTWSGYLYLALQHPGLIFYNKHISLLRGICIWLLLMLQLLVYFFVSISPSIFLGGFHYSIRQIVPPNADGLLTQGVWLAIVALYFVFVVRHVTHTYEDWMFNLLHFISAVVTLCSIALLTYYVATHPDVLDPIGLLEKSYAARFTTIGVYMVLAVMVLPLLLAFMHSPWSFLLMCVSVFPYYCFLPMLVGFLGAYSFARSWDLTWGNRPSGGPDKSHDMKKAAEMQLKAYSYTLCAYIVGFNLVWLLVQEAVLTFSVGTFALAAIIFAAALLQMIIGSVFFVGYIFRRLWNGIVHTVCCLTSCCRTKRPKSADSYPGSV